MLGATNKITALYCRLSQEDERLGESVSMEKTILLSERIRIRQKQLDRDEKRISELKRLFMKVYEDNAARRLNDERYDMLSQSYEAEQKQLEAKKELALIGYTAKLNAMLW